MKITRFKITLVDVPLAQPIAASETEYRPCIAGSETHCISVEHMPWCAAV